MLRPLLGNLTQLPEKWKGPAAPSKQALFAIRPQDQVKIYHRHRLVWVEITALEFDGNRTVLVGKVISRDNEELPFDTIIRFEKEYVHAISSRS